MNIEEQQEKAKIKGIIAIISIALVLVLGFFSFILFGYPAISRYQAVLDQENKNKVKILAEQNEIQVNTLRIQQTEQLVNVENQKAQIKIAEANGISQAQHIINSTLTDKYLQHEAIQAQEKMANSPNHSTIYIPSGQNGIPIIKTLDDK